VISPSEPVEVINQRLKDRFGLWEDGQPNFRLIWSTGLTEYRFTKRSIYLPEGMFLREESGVLECLKYPDWQDMWILEKLVPNLANTELKTSLSYEPFWVFGSAKSDPRPVWDKIEILIHLNLFVDKIKKSPQDIEDDEIERMAKEKERFKIMISNESPYIAGALADGAAVTVPGSIDQVEKPDA
jgi:hypothetical protein